MSRIQRIWKSATFIPDRRSVQSVRELIINVSWNLCTRYFPFLNPLGLLNPPFPLLPIDDPTRWIFPSSRPCISSEKRAFFITHVSKLLSRKAASYLLTSCLLENQPVLVDKYLNLDFWLAEKFNDSEINLRGKTRKQILGTDR